MKTPLSGAARVLLALHLFATGMLHAQELPRFTEAVRQTNSDVVLKVAVTAGQHFRLEVADELPQWRALATIKSTGTNAFTDVGGGFVGARFYRAVEVEAAGAFVGDHFATTEGEVVVRPINHASFVMRWNDLCI